MFFFLGAFLPPTRGAADELWATTGLMSCGESAFSIGGSGIDASCSHELTDETDAGAASGAKDDIGAGAACETGNTEAGTKK